MNCSNPTSPTKKYQDTSPIFYCNFSKNKLVSTLKKFSNEKVYFYVIKSVVKEKGEYKQSGCGPNFEGGLITLTTCKHFMRTFPNIKKGCWIAGFTSTDLDNDNYLYYLARIESKFETHFQLWNTLDTKTRQIKSASENILGDIFEPLGNNGSGWYSFKSYREPNQNHVHRAKKVWHDDISYQARKKHAKILKFDPNLSFVYSKPKLKSIIKIGRAQRVAGSLDIFFNEVIL